MTRWRAIIRSDIPARLTAEGQDALIDYGVRTILDLRDPAQVQEEPSIFMQPNNDAETPTYLNIPLETRIPAVEKVNPRSGAKTASELVRLLDGEAVQFTYDEGS